jgi:ketosteroid isomerase-like protein
MTDTIEIETFLAEWAAAELAGDTDALDRLLTDDFVGIGPLGFILAKPQWLDRHRNGLIYDAFDIDETDVRAYGAVAVVTARHNQRGNAFGHPIPEAVRAIHVLTRDAQRWRLAIVQMSFIAGTHGAPPLPGPVPPTADSTEK